MRVTGGSLKGRIFKIPKNPDIRPSTDKTREAIFSSLGADIVGAEIADLFCGSGALGLEALSRGAARALFVDIDRSAISTVRGNIEALGLESKSRVMTLNVFNLRPKHLTGLAIIFADPPYRGDYARRLVELLSLPKFGWYGILTLEHESAWEYKGDDFQMLRRLEFGETSVSFLFWPRPDGDPPNGGERTEL